MTFDFRLVPTSVSLMEGFSSRGLVGLFGNPAARDSPRLAAKQIICTFVKEL